MTAKSMNYAGTARWRHDLTHARKMGVHGASTTPESFSGIGMPCIIQADLRSTSAVTTAVLSKVTGSRAETTKIDTKGLIMVKVLPSHFPHHPCIRTLP